MSLYFNWSCDFQRFTKSKKLSKFQVRTTTFVLLNKSLSTSLFNLQGTICCFQRVFTTFRCSQPLINSLFSISKPEAFVKNFFSNSFSEPQSVLNQTFRFCACLSETALIEYQIREHLSNTFFVFCKKFCCKRKTAAHAVVFSFSRCSDKIKPLSAKTVPSHMIGVMVSCRINAELTIVITGVA